MLLRPHPLARFALITALVLAGGAHSSQAQLITNGEFDTNELGWATTADSTWAWDGEDAMGLAGSGSARFGNTAAPASSQVRVQQCVTLGPDTALVGDYLLRFAAKIPNGQSETGSLRPQVTWYGAPGCNGTAVIGSVTIGPPLTATGDWYSIETVAGIGELPTTVRIAFLLNKNEAGGSFEVLLDEVRFDAGLLFLDGFETGDTMGWSSASP